MKAQIFNSGLELRMGVITNEHPKWMESNVNDIKKQLNDEFNKEYN